MVTKSPISVVFPVFALIGFIGLSLPAHAHDRIGALDLATIDRVTWGLDERSVEAVSRVGLKRWLQDELHPPSAPRLPPEVQARIDALPISQRPMAEWVSDVDVKSKANRQVKDPEQKHAAQSKIEDEMSDLANQARAISILRDLYSSNQLQERMTWFWDNHFSVYSEKPNLRILIGDYEGGAIRPHALGRFRDLLEATLRHPAMLQYLDNVDNAAGHVNENYAREIMELHTMGVGSGYTQKDVEELARILTGVGVDLNPEPPKLKPEHAGDLVRDGLFEFNPDRHDYGDKVLLDHRIAGSGYDEVRQALEILCHEPATARHVSKAIATYFVGDEPPPRLVDRMAERFRRSDGDIAAVLDTLFASPEFKASLGHQMKDPVEYVLSAIRLTYGATPILNPKPAQDWMARLGEGLFGRVTPDGYPLDGESWSAPGQMAARFEIARLIGANSAGLFRAPGASADAPAFPQLQNGLYFAYLDQGLSAPTRQSLGQAISSADWNTLFLSSPEFMRH